MKLNSKLCYRLISKTKIDIETECWLWIGGISGKSQTSNGGYGMVWYNGGMRYIHRLSAHLFLDYNFLSTLQVNHKCNNKNCWNPGHLYIGTQAENINDTIINKRLEPGIHNTIKTHCPQGHEYNEENTYTHPIKGRQCRTCKNESQQERRKEETEMIKKFGGIGEV